MLKNRLYNIFLILTVLGLSVFLVQSMPGKIQETHEQLYRGLLIFLDDTEQHISSISGDLLKAISQKTGPMLVSASLLRNIFSEYKNIANGNPKVLLKDFNSLSYDNSDSAQRQRKQIFLKALDFQENQWVIKEISNYLYLLIPAGYAINLFLNDWENIKDYKPGSLSGVELKLGLKVNHMKTVTLNNFMEKSQESGNLAVDFLKSLSSFDKDNKKISDIFCIYSDYKDALDYRVVWSIYMTGHGTLNRTIAGLSFDQFNTVLDFLDKTIDCRLLVYDSCYAAGVNTDAIYKDHQMVLQKTYSFPIITKALTDAPTQASRPGVFIIEELFSPDKLKINTFGMRFDEFFKLITAETIDYSKVINSIYEDKHANEAQIKRAGAEWFSPLEINKDRVSIGETLVAGRDSNKALDIEKFFKKDPRLLLLYVTAIPFKLVLNKNLSGIISMVSGDATHKILCLSSSTQKILQILDSFMQIEDLASRKLFFIKMIYDDQGREYKNIVIYNPKASFNQDLRKNNWRAYYKFADDVYYYAKENFSPKLASSQEVNAYNRLLAEVLGLSLGSYKFTGFYPSYNFDPIDNSNPFPEKLNTSIIIKKIISDSSIDDIIDELKLRISSSGLFVLVNEITAKNKMMDIDVPDVQKNHKTTIKDVVIGKGSSDILFMHNEKFYKNKGEEISDYREEYKKRIGSTPQKESKSLLPLSITSDGIEKLRSAIIKGLNIQKTKSNGLEKQLEILKDKLNTLKDKLKTLRAGLVLLKGKLVPPVK